jgi:hypothetical protein
LRAAFGIDVSGPEFFDLFPTREAIADRLISSGQFRGEAIAWISSAAHEHLADAGTTRGAVDLVVRSGDPLSREAVKALGFYPTTKVGHRYAAAIAANDAPAATERLRHDLHVACSSASQLHNLRRMSEMGVVQVIFSSCRDERSTALEKLHEGKPLSIADARNLVLSDADQISRSVFIAVINF